MKNCPQYISATSRRQLLAAGGTAVLTAVAGCSSVVDLIADQFLEDVNVFNETEQQLSGTIQVIGPADETVLSEAFDLSPTENDDDDDGSTAIFEDVWTESGPYEAVLELDDAEIDGQSQAAETVTIDNPDDEMLGVPLGAENVDEPIGFRVGADLTDLHEE